jgi:hypothetical protein
MNDEINNKIKTYFLSMKIWPDYSGNTIILSFFKKQLCKPVAYLYH